MTQSLKEAMRQGLEADEWRRSRPYDGVLGVLPFPWPENFHRDFQGARDRLLNDGHSPEELRAFIAEVIDVQQRALENPDSSPEFNPATPFDIWQDVSVLAMLAAAINLGEDGGLAFLTDPLHARKASTGAKFIGGRRPGTGGPIRKAIAKLLAKNSALKNPQIWEVLKGKPPKGWNFFDNNTGKYIEGPSMANMNYERFCTVCGEERKKRKAKITG